MFQFFKSVMACIVGIVLFTIFSLVFVVVVAAVVGGGKTVGPNSVLVLDLNGSLAERSQQDVYSSLGLDDYMPGLDDVTSAIYKASTDENVRGIYIRPGAFTAGQASVDEIASALQVFRQTGKFVYSYSGAYTQPAYAICACADSVFLNPAGSVDIHGMAYRTVFFKRLLSKVGVEMQMVRVGRYKSYVETYTATKMSDDNREQGSCLVRDCWEAYKAQVAAVRHLEPSVLDSAADGMCIFWPAEQVLGAGLVDSLAYADGVMSVLRRRMALAADEDVPLVSVADYLGVESELPVSSSSTGDHKVAVVYALGEIDNGTTDGIDSKKLSKQILDIAADSSVSAVVLRVNSPGGSAYGAEQIWHALSVLSSHKLVVCSMGDYAASGGYYISTAAERIFAWPQTFTGSIGIFGIIPNIGPLADKIGVDYDVVKTSASSDFPRVVGPMDPIQAKAVQAYVGRGYEVFVDRCCKGRGKTRAQIDSIAQGRVWSGASARRIGLVDEAGGLTKAISYACAKKGLPFNPYNPTENVVFYPRKMSALEALYAKPSLGVRAAVGTVLSSFEGLFGTALSDAEALQNVLKIDMLQASVPVVFKVE